MNHLLSSFTEAISVFKRDRWVVLLSFIPIIIGIGFYLILGNWLYGDLFDWGKSLIESKVSSSWLSFISGFIIFLLSVIFYFLINWTFVVAVSFLASPFNDLISQRVENLLEGKKPLPLSESFSVMMKNLGKVIINECKKISLLLFLSLIGFLVSFFLPPLGFIISALLFSVNFIDYSWSRNNLEFHECIKNIKKSFIPYMLAGGVFLLMISIPIVNLLILPFATVYYTVLYIKNKAIHLTD